MIPHFKQKYSKTFTIPEFPGVDFSLNKNGNIVEINAWINTRTFSKNLSGWSFDDSFKSSIKVPNPISASSQLFMPDGIGRVISERRYFQINNGYFYLYNRSNANINNILQGGFHYVYITDE